MRNSSKKGMSVVDIGNIIGIFSVQWIFSVDWMRCFISYSPDFANE